jgi:hypothetical protein
MTATRDTEIGEQELPADMVSAWATVVLDIHERDRRAVAEQGVVLKDMSKEESSSCPST